MKMRKFILLPADLFINKKHEISPSFVPRITSYTSTSRHLHLFRLLALFLFINLSYGLQTDHALCASGANKDKNHIRVGIFQYYPIVFEKNGSPTGFHLELLKEVAKKEGWTLNFQFSGSLKNLLNGLESGALDLGMGIIPNEKNKRFLGFTKENNALLNAQIFIRSERQDIQNINDLHQKAIGLVRRDALGENFLEVCGKMGISPSIKMTNSYDDLAAAVITGGVDAAVFSSLQGHYYSRLFPGISSTPIVFKPVEVQYAAPLGSNSIVIEIIDNYLRELKLTKGSLYHKLSEEFLRDPSHQNNAIDKRELIMALCISLLFIAFGFMVGFSLINKNVSGKTAYARPYVRDIFVFTLTVSLSFWLIDSLVLWLSFNEKQKTLLELTITNIPRENIYIRGTVFIICCFFGFFLAKYVKRYEETYSILLQSVNRFEQLTDNAKDMIFHMSLPSGKYEFVNKASSHIFGYSPEEFYRKPLLIQDLVHPKWRKYFRSKWESLLAGEDPPDYEYQVIDREGDTKWISQRNTLYFDDNGTPSALEGILTDVTEKKGL